MSQQPRHWLMKAEPDSRVVKGKDVKFSVDDFETAGTTPWEGVRNHEAKNLMKSMKVGDKVLFYHSNCKTPGIAGLAEVSKEAYPDYTAWDPKHPYFDPKSDEKEPKWYMVDVKFVSRAPHFVPLALLKTIAGGNSSDPPEEVGYIGKQGVKAIKEMALVNRGRLSVQPVEEDTWNVVKLLAEKDGWTEATLGISTKGKGRSKTTAPDKPKPKPKAKSKKEKQDGQDEEVSEDGPGKGQMKSSANSSGGKKRKAKDEDEVHDDPQPLRRSTRARK